MKTIALRLIEINSKTWLSDKLGITRPTLDNRLEKGNWKKGEIVILRSLDKSLV